MFGVVPKSLWKRLNEPDENNMCTWSMRCLLIEDGERKILIDTGLGDKQDLKFRSHFYPHGDDSLVKSLGNSGFGFEDITDVFLTHLHFDHVGGAVSKDTNGNLIPTFPNATYWSNEKHWEWALTPNPREKASFLKENIVPLQDHNVLKFIDVEDGVKFTDSISIDFVYGHTEAMMVPYIKLDNGKTLVYTADLLPSHCHIGMPYVMGYDIRPLSTLKEKERLYEKAVDTNHMIFFEHDKDIACAELVRNERGRVVLGEEVKL
ncbi:MAG: MBL fold metallo-hydrolase [Melioribacteraceae bacterium]|nr:MBL fold metallo-hydrolase [Melioribacteraceae bacterium]